MQHIYDGNAWLRVCFQVGRTCQDLAMELYSRHQAGERVYWLRDGRNANARRRAIFSGYKVKDYSGEEMQQFFRYADFFTKAYLPLLGFVSLQIPEYEADDVIRFLCQDTEKPTTVHTVDQDLYDLTLNPNVQWQSNKPYNLPCTAEDLTLFKALVGDSSDKIKGLTNFGASAFLKLTQEEKHLLRQALIAQREQPPVIESLGKTKKAQNLIAEWEQVKQFWIVVNPMLPHLAEVRENLIIHQRASSIGAILAVPTHGDQVEEILNGHHD